MKKTSLLAVFAASSATFLGGCTIAQKVNHFQYKVADCAVVVAAMKGEEKNLVKEYDFSRKTLTVWNVTKENTTLRAEFKFRDKPFAKLNADEEAEAKRLEPLLPKACRK